MGGNTLAAQLADGLQSLHLECSDKQQAQLLKFVQLLEKWNKIYNLTAVRDRQEMVTRHLLDSLSILPYLQGQRVLDVGTGAGLPGIPLAIACPEREFVLLDSNSKKTRFVQQAVAELELPNVSVIQSRVEDFLPTIHPAFRTKEAFDVVLSRAFASIADMLDVAGPLCAPDGVILAMKGQKPANELNRIPQGYTVEGVYPLQVPGLDEDRHLVCLRPDGDEGGDEVAG